MNEISNVNFYKPVKPVGIGTFSVPQKTSKGGKSAPAFGNNELQNYSAGGADRINTPNNPFPDIKKMYSKVAKATDAEGRALLNKLYKNGKLLSRDSSDGTSTLQNLYNIATKPRLKIFDRKNIIRETLKTIDNPFLITQNIGVIPESRMNGYLQTANQRLLAETEQAKAQGDFNPDDIADQYPIKPQDVNGIHSATCAASSIEFDMAYRRPAEFTRYIEGFTSPAKQVKTTVKYADLSPDMTEALTALVSQKAEFAPIDWEHVEITIRPDENAYMRADVQEDARVKNTRSMVDVLMQGAFMELGSRNTYNGLTDKRSKEVGGGGGLNQFEIAFVESIVDSKSRKIPIVYMELDDDMTKITKRYYTHEQIKQHYLNAIDMKKSVITGFLTDIDDKDNVITPQGHEIIIVDKAYDKNGKLHFVYQDSDDKDFFAPSYIAADELIPKIHHANIAQDALKEPIEQPDMRFVYLSELKNLRNKHAATQI
ncbi:MAG: hypothetical protein GX568_02675 [Candidatus Gastranaerophilales bacterium]|nr:hypothetical protein [Candidatus Gastranaerophilales bacterium]